MSHQEKLTYYIAQFVDELARSGITDVVISPGSRSTPLALTFAEHSSIRHWVNLDERSAAFFALGMAKEQNRPVALVCTSGTATANYYPAIIEASYSRVPLVVLTADRPHELRDTGAPQAIDQIKMYGDYVKWFHEMALPEKHESMLNYARSMASRAAATAYEGNPGPVQLNFPLREPLVPDFHLPDIWESPTKDVYFPHVSGKRTLDEHQLDQVLSQLTNRKQGLLVCGPQMDTGLRESMARLAKTWNIPILADPLSQLRTGPHSKELVIESYDSILKSSEVRSLLKPDFIIRFGAMPVSKPYRFFMEENPDILHIVVEAYEGYREPTLTNTHYIYGDPAQFCIQSADYSAGTEMDPDWTDTWKNLNEMVRRKWAEGEELTEGHTVSILNQLIQDRHLLFVGNSMPIRDVDTFFTAVDRDCVIAGNRGANGIDGTISSAAGAAAHGRKVTLLLGDLTFFHDLNGLHAVKQYGIDLTVIVINNNGGGIFSFLPQAKESSDHFEVLFGTPLDLDFQHAVAMYGGHYERITSLEHLKSSLNQAYNHGGLQVLEVQTNREENAEWHRKQWNEIEAYALEILGEN
ncbi:2-succinyl-5-enolpyruvyl-6-hydroxy-3-cyclohexene-1-carboxylic-acid synthase [Virgibacillus sp. MSP4-1]|uniref:2-succinyl-5-enolpyruvyl-6-hydroxy-3- cyclohexene-1-carboxylic-acid synthase n=1 Tax=Virgibacillus sp. MSP4-1 TaxID=2700081 RepID=UPI0003A59C17|nr:2-succinyl-5-enolpyruvyl-6-hydroxy-3-cyclohexene-1-carboxylic-acid synthase [Virgibacillus sp. MSP4-1]QHS23104.1 2-succinyl-5-enolpyruvyl-6-hydroxy-3-cyclohexene-1-carboxylic-acid synthase [Virgibacillus sp. MSP4-1]